MTPTWYDVLGVEQGASAEEVRAAWRGAIADLEPGDRRFRSLNEAAEVLLDPERRAAYDAQLVPEPDPEPDPEPLAGPEPADEESTSVVSDLEAERAEARERAREGRRPIPALLLAVLGLLVLAMVCAAAYLATQPSDEAIAESTSEAQSSAERAVVTILSYDYREMDQDQEAAGDLMTDSYRAKYDALFEQLKANAPELEVVVSCEVVASGIVRSGEDRVQVLVFVNRPTERADLTAPRTYRDQVRLTMERSGDDWLVDDMQTSRTAA